MKWKSVLTKTLLPLAALCCLAQQPTTTEQGSPVTTFQSATRLVVLDVVVTDNRGNPVRNLTKNDFTVLEDGKPQVIDSFEGSDQHPPVSLEARQKNGETNPEVGPARIGAEPLTILVFDALDTKIVDQAYARYEIKRFLKAHGPRLAQPTVLMALEEKRLELLRDYTRDTRELERALDSHRTQLPFRLLLSMGEGDTYVGADRQDAAEQFMDAVQALREIASANMQFAGRKNLIWIGPGFPSLGRLVPTPTGGVFGDNAAGIYGDESLAWSGVGFRDLNKLKAGSSRRLTVQSWEQETLELLWRARISIYTIDPRGLEVVPEEQMTPPTGDLAFEQVAPLTGGRIIRETNDIDVRIAKSMDESSAYYAISYYPSNHEWDGKFRRIRVVVQNPQLSAIAREGYYAVLDSSPAPEDLDRLLSLAVINPLSYHSLQIQARARLSGTQQQRTAHLEVTLDANRLHWETPAADNRPCEITVVAAGFSTKGVLVTHALKEFQINVDEKKYARLTKTGMLMGLSMPIPPAAVRMRVVVRDSTNGNMGTADLTPEGDQFH